MIIKTGSTAEQATTDRRSNAPVDRDRLESMCAEYSATRSDALRRTIVEQHDWLVRICAKQMVRRGETLDDLLQVGYIGLIKALERFDPAFQVRFRTFASVTIDGELRRYFRSTWRVHVARSVQERHHAVSRATEAITASKGATPTVAELAAYVGATEREVIEAMGAGAAFAPAPLEHDGRDDRSVGLGDPSANGSFDRAEHRIVLAALLEALGERERRVVFLRYFEDCTQLEIAQELGISQVHVSRLLRGAVARMRTAAGTPEFGLAG